MKKKFFAVLFMLFAVVLPFVCGCSEDTMKMGGHPVGKFEYSNDATDYKFYYPDSWQVQTDNGMICLYVASDDPSNFSVTKFGLGEDFKTLDEYISGLPHSFMSEWNAVFGQTDFGTPENFTLGGEDAKKYTYEATINDVTYKYMQVFTLHQNSVYTLTFAARTELFDKHLDNVNAILESFEFKA